MHLHLHVYEDERGVWTATVGLVTRRGGLALTWARRNKSRQVADRAYELLKNKVSSRGQ